MTFTIGALLASPHARRTAAAAALLTSVIGCGAAPPQSGKPKQARKGDVTALRPVPDRVDGKVLLTPDAARAKVAGAGALQVVGADIASEGDRVGGFIEIPAAECVLVLARTSATVTDVDLFAYDDDGSAFATDESPEPQATLIVCPPHPRRLYVVGRVMSGTGFLSVGVQSVPASAADAVAKAVDARGRPGDDSGRLDSWPGLEAKVRKHRLSIGARWEDVRRVALPVGPRAPSRVTVAIEPGRCADVLVVPSDEVASLEVVAEDESGRIIARGREQGRDRALTLCSGEAVDVTIAVRPRSSQGLVAVVMGRSHVGAEVEISEATRIERVTQTLDLTAARRAHERALASLRYGPVKVAGRGAARAGSRSTVAVDLPAGCARVDAIAGKPLGEMAAELWDDKGSKLGEATGGTVASVFACGPGGAARLDVEALGRPGPFAVEVRADKAAPPALVSHPMAAGRLLARMNAGGALADASAAAGVTVVPLDSALMKRLPLPIAAQSCTEVIAAVDVGGAGVDLRLVDTASNESTLSRARSVVADRMCAGASPVVGVAELRLGTGKADVLVLTRSITGP
jgi:hypothetical protein